MSTDAITAFASLGTLVVILATAIAAFVQLRHLRTANQLEVLNDFRREYERVHVVAREALPQVDVVLATAAGRHELVTFGSPEWVRPLMPLVRLFEMLGSYANRDIVSRDLVCDQWAPVIVHWWVDCAPLIAVWRRTAGPTLLENWEAIVVHSERWLALERSTYPHGLSRYVLHDPWAEVDGAPATPPAGDASAP